MTNLCSMCFEDLPEKGSIKGTTRWNKDQIYCSIKCYYMAKKLKFKI